MSVLFEFSALSIAHTTTMQSNTATSTVRERRYDAGGWVSRRVASCAALLNRSGAITGKVSFCV